MKNLFYLSGCETYFILVYLLVNKSVYLFCFYLGV